MADDTPPRQMSLVPYSNESAVVLRRGNAIVVYDPQSRQLQVRDTSDQPVEVPECPYCHRPYHSEPSRGRGSESHGRTFSPKRPFVDDEYFSMLAASQRASPDGSGASTPSRRLFQPAALRSGRSRDVSGVTVGPPSGAEFMSSAPSADSAHADRISRSSISPGYFKRNFKEERVLGKGGNGEVLLVEHVMDQISLGQFACKRIPVGNGHSWLEKVLLEVTMLQKIRHENMVIYHYSWLEDHRPNRFGPSVPCLWMLQEYCNGGDLQAYVLGPKEASSSNEALKARMRRKSRGDPEPPKDLRGLSKLSFDEIFSFFRDITSGLHHLHSKGYIHRDLKPSNCLLQHDGGVTKVLISDFGEVQVAGSRRGSTGATGTISYCAPEVLTRGGQDGTFGNFSTKSDIFSLGMIVHFMCFGRLPYSNADDINEENEDLDQLREEITAWPGFDDQARARPDLHEKLYKFLKRLLSVDPNERPSTADILESIGAGGNLSGGGVEDGGVRVSALDSPTHRPSPPGRKQSTHLSRPGLSSLGRRRSSSIAARSLSPAKARAGSRSEDASRPLSPVEGAITVRPRKIELPAPPEVEVPPQHSPRLMLPPPPPSTHPVVGRMVRLAQHSATVISLRAAIFIAKLLVLLLPCAPYAANIWLTYPMLGLAALDLGLLTPSLRRSLLLAGIHVAVVAVAARKGYQCERPGRLFDGDAPTPWITD
ncbi:putative serine/threonine-protein kinase iks1 [Elasticomyces elasticus]|nr:putative serine/threonine-protein kinase iks1 [Elasticomyces elasticus]KAK4976973.1 putative serine/threonine-protein kinase iks1 [Elasticomyces elasticus]